MSEVTVSLPKPHAAQRGILAGAKRLNVVVCGRRFGKTILGVNRLVMPALRGKPVAYYAPTYRMLQDVWRDVRRIVHPVCLRVAAQEHRIELITGGVIDMWSMDAPDSSRGRKYARVVLDEAAIVAGLETTWNEAIRPTLTDMRGDGWFLSTPKGHNFFWTLFCRGQDPLEPNYASWQMPTTANPYIDPEEVEEARKNLPERSFAQEYLAEFIEEGGGVFRGVSECVDRGRHANEPAGGSPLYCLGVDLARVEDFTVLTVLDAKGRQVYHERFNQISWERQIATIVRVANAYNARVLIDSTGVGDPIFEALRRQNIRIQGLHFTNQTKEQVIDALAMAIENRDLRLMDLPQQTAELQAYQYELTPSRNVRMNAPEGMHDDCVISLGLANWLRALPKPGRAVAGGGRDTVQAYQELLRRQGVPGERR